ncbi:MAG: hypothetical protein A2W11_11295 [Ignavibacteria bacterium RBG_16_35_7]|nr:MAG: hypothetical protein A2W11_11295 [Ignavibacteria bacterium RBG_16_35_7]
MKHYTKFSIIKIGLITIFIQLLTIETVLGKIIHIPSDYPTIQEGINAAVDGDTVLVDLGMYIENLNFNGMAILIASNYIITGDSTDIDATIIDGGAIDVVVRFISGEDNTSRIVGFTIQNGASNNGGGILCVGSSPLIDYLIIKQNLAQFGGGGIACQFDANPIITNCRINENSALFGGGIWISGFGSNPIIIGEPGNLCNIYNNVSLNEYGLGSDLYSMDSRILTVQVDTFSILNPDESQIYPINQFIMNITTPYFSPIYTDTYVSPIGDNTNDGLTPNTPFKNIWYAILRTIGSPADSFTIHILPGTYSLTLTGERTLHPRSYVSLVGEDSSTTIINGDGQICLIYCYRDSNLNISNLTIRNGNASQGAGIYCEESSPTITRNTIIENGNSLGGTGTGGGIYCKVGSSPTIITNRIVSNFSFGIKCDAQSHPTISENIITRNMGGGIICLDQSDPAIVGNTISSDSIGWGSGILCDNSNPVITNNTIIDNVYVNGGGISCTNNSNALITNNIITHNSTSTTGDGVNGKGGGIYCSDSNPVINNNIISNNKAFGISAYGGGIYCISSNPIITNNTITENSAKLSINTQANSKGGGIYLEGSSPVIGGSEGKDNIFQSNIALTGADLFSTGSPGIINAQYNTFNIYPLSEYYVKPLQDFNLNNGQGLYAPITQDVYVSPIGSNTNDGLSEQTPFLNIQFALGRVLPSPSNHLTIYLAPGIYSPSKTEESFPLPLLNYASLKGSGRDSSILDGEWTDRVIYCMGIDSLTISDIRIQGGRAGSGGGIYCESSNLVIFNNSIMGNSADWGAGIYCTINSHPFISYNIISNNSTIGFPYWAKLGGGIFIDENSNPLIINNLITSNNSIDYGGGIAINGNSNPRFVNNTISMNSANDGGGILSWNNSHPIIENSILWNNSAPINPEISECCNSTTTVLYSDVPGGWPGIGNINTDPLFTDTINFYLSEISKCIDAGNPDSTFNDPEDPLNPGYALWPAMGTLRNDMGTYGGPGAAGQLPVSVEEPDPINQIPIRFALYQNFPNPFNPTTVISWQLPISGYVSLKVYDVLGNEITTLVNEEKPAGSNEIEFDASGLPSGIYFYKLQAGNFVETKKMILLK